MRASLSPAPRRRRVLGLVATGLAVLLAVVGMAMRDRGSGAASEPRPPSPASTREESTKAPRDDGPPGGAPAPINPSSNPVEFAATVGEALFAWDTATGLEPGDYRGRLLVVADPTGAEAPGLVADLDAYLPDAATWRHLAEYSTRQWLDIGSAEVPRSWDDVVASAPSESIVPGASAVTVTGVRHRAGVWDGADVVSKSDVAFTVFVVCRPTFPTCYLLRLSERDNPMR